MLIAKCTVATYLQKVRMASTADEAIEDVYQNKKLPKLQKCYKRCVFLTRSAQLQVLLSSSKACNRT